MPKKLSYAALVIASAVSTGALADEPTRASAVEAQQFDATDQAVCKLASSLSPEDFSTYTVENLVTPTGLKISSTEQGGVMRMGTIEAGSNDVTVSEFGVSADGEAPNEGNQLLSSRILPYAGRTYFLSYSGTHPLYLWTITRFLPSGKVMPVCDLKPKTDVNLWTPFVTTSAKENKAVEAADKEVCDHTQRGRVAYLKERRYTRDRPIYVKGTDTWTVVGSIAVDFRNSGKAEKLEIVEGDTGSYNGCMSSVEFIARGKTWDHNDRVLAQLQDRQSSHMTTGFQSEGECHDGPVRWFVYKRKTYLETQSYHSRDPQNEFQEYWFVSTAEAGHVRRVCAPFYLHEQPELAAVYKAGHLIEE